MEKSSKIDMNNIDKVRNSLETESLKVCIVGIGRIGLPTALSFAQAGLQTIGADINEKLVDSINAGNFPLKDEPGYEDIFNSVRKNGNFSATTDINEAISKSNVILLSLPTPMDENNIPIYLAAVNQKMVELAWNVADGVIFYLRPKNELKSTLASMQAKKKIDASIQIITCVHPDSEKAINRAKKTLAFYVSVSHEKDYAIAVVISQ